MQKGVPIVVMVKFNEHAKVKESMIVENTLPPSLRLVCRHRRIHFVTLESWGHDQVEKSTDKYKEGWTYDAKF